MTMSIVFDKKMKKNPKNIFSPKKKRVYKPAFYMVHYLYKNNLGGYITSKKERTKKPMKKGAKWALVIFIWGFSAYFLVALSGFIAATVSNVCTAICWKRTAR